MDFNVFYREKDGGIDFKTAAKLLGHDIDQTMKTYSHVNDDMIKNAKNIINKFFSPNF